MWSHMKLAMAFSLSRRADTLRRAAMGLPSLIVLRASRRILVRNKPLAMELSSEPSQRRCDVEENMDKKIAGLLGAAAALTTFNGAQATPAQPPLAPAAAYRDLLEPVPNAVEALKADDARLAAEATGQPVRLA